jgi:hypothetical protein
MPKVFTSRRSPNVLWPYRGGRPHHVERPLHIRRSSAVQPALGPAAAASDPLQELRHAVDLIVVPSVGKAEQLAVNAGSIQLEICWSIASANLHASFAMMVLSGGNMPWHYRRSVLHLHRPSVRFVS